MEGTATDCRRRFWLCADDYGIAPGVNVAIRDLVARRRLNATSVMVVAPSLTKLEAVALSALNAGEQRVAIGLHLTLTGPLEPLTAGYAPLEAGAFLPLTTTLRLAMQQRLDVAAMTREFHAQFEAFAKVFGGPPDFVDGHQHVHLFPQVRQAALEVTAAAAPGVWMRQCGASAPLLRRLRDPKGLLIDWLSREFRARAAGQGITTNPAFAGTYAFKPNADFATIFPRFLDGLPDGGLVMCHPGHVDAELQRLDPLTTLREREYEYFCGDAFADLLEKRGFRLN